MMKKSGIRTSLVMLTTLLSLASCIVTDPTLGSALVPADQNITIKTATIDLPVTLRMADSLQCAVSQSATVGAIRSGDFGLFHADAAFSLTASTDSVIWGANPSVRSVYITLVLDTTVVVDASQLHIPQNIYVHQLNVELDSTMVYNNSLKDDDYNPVPLSDGGSVFIGDESYLIHLKKEFGERLLKIPMETLDSAELFMKACHGLYLRCDDPDEHQIGGRLNCFDLSSSYLVLNWEYDDEDGNRKTNTTNFSLGSYYSVNRMTAGSRQLETADISHHIYQEGLCGIKPHIDARQLRDAVTGWAAAEGIETDKLLLAKATLTFPFEYDGDRNQYDYFADNLFPCKRVRGTARVNYNPIDEINDTSLESGTIDRSLLQYKSNVSQYLQDLLSRDREEITEDDDLWMMPILSYYDSYSSTTYYYSDYYYYSQSVLNGVADERHPVIQLTYAVLD